LAEVDEFDIQPVTKCRSAELGIVKAVFLSIILKRFIHQRDDVYIAHLGRERAQRQPAGQNYRFDWRVKKILSDLNKQVFKFGMVKKDVCVLHEKTGSQGVIAIYFGSKILCNTSTILFSIASGVISLTQNSAIVPLSRLSAARHIMSW
jgi:hypothetical protein